MTHPSSDSTFRVSLTRGIECYFDVAEHTIHVWGSAWSGREVVQVDGTTVSDKRNMHRLRHFHEFTLDGQPYRLELRTESILRGQYAAILSRDGQVIDTDRGCYPSFGLGLATTPWRAALIIIGLFVGGVVAGALIAALAAGVGL